ncbi:hypothetical protein [Sphingosinithalassobacter portus]|uniref:hypothetical protein n=1 Tax=Stakelama portus TaxID=2676234 RepID=UPI000D6DF2F6|nr:hypothetical protein [Sphingosinithalassobacter portus]
MTGSLTPIAGFALMLTIAAMLALVAGGVWMIAKRNDRRRGILMIVCAAVMLGNVLIWTL